ncbi:MAG TPA: MFS transporter [Burkholderiales bacterium]|nr:MFS transporter [Burkholderiales bacterium]
MFVILYAAMYGAYGVASPFLPAFVTSRGIGAQELGILLAAGTLARLVSAPLAGRIADYFGVLRGVLAVCIVLAAVATLGYLRADGFRGFLIVAVIQAAALAPMTVLADALALRGPFEYGWVRGTGSAAFIVGTLAAGFLISSEGLAIIIVLQCALLTCASIAATRVPEIPHPPERAARARGIRRMLALPAFRLLVLVAALIVGSHAMHDAFAMIRWREAGIAPGTASVLWSLAVAAEVVVFFFVGPRLVTKLGSANAIALAAGAGMVRWSVMALTTEVWALALVQPLHGITFALLHLACMRIIARIVPGGLEGTAQALYATVGIGGASALVMVASGTLYSRFGPEAFWVMAALCLVALPLTPLLRKTA